MVLVEGAGGAVELVTGVVAGVTGVMVFPGGGANPSTCIAFGLISFVDISASVFCVSSNLSLIFKTFSRISLHTMS